MSEIDGTARILRLLARKLEEYLDGSELALESLADEIERENATADELHTAILGIRSLAGLSAPAGWVADVPGRHAHRMLSAEEQGTLSTETWGYLLELRASGTLDAGQFERVIETLTACGDRPVEVERAREVASRVALEIEDHPGPGETGHGDQEVAH